MKFTISLTLLTLLATASAAAISDAGLVLKRQQEPQPKCGEFRDYCGSQYPACCKGYSCKDPTSGQFDIKECS